MKRTSGGPEISDQKPICTASLADLDHLRLRATRHVAQANAFGAHFDDRNQLQLERTLDDEGASDALRDERFDAALVPAEIAKRDVEHDGKQCSTDDAKEDTEETPDATCSAYPL